ncbi:hypothetical protein PR048_026500 [Dryococelus australis]|uniref:Uncharacterized protein n=1 Tax=Dryococelus australis TaxID=614101 RepID=A0ABQ9GLH4_9NEOP|nr:hypothetical protein PR048_026500 [Dryococelus australis]
MTISAPGERKRAKSFPSMVLWFCRHGRTSACCGRGKNMAESISSRPIQTYCGHLTSTT